MQLHGSSYVTFDLDIAYDRTRENAALLAHALSQFDPRSRGLPADIPFVFDARTILSSELLTLTTSAGDIDLLGVVKGIGSYRELESLAETISLDGFEIAVLGITGLILAKRAAGRPKDAAGLIELEAMREVHSLIDEQR